MVERSHAQTLLSEQHGERAQALEAAVFSALAVDPAALPIRRLADRYRTFSERLLQVVAEPGNPTGDVTADHDLDTILLWAIVYGARTFHVTHRLIDMLKLNPESMVEIGGGWGPAALAFALRGSHTAIVDVAPRQIAFGREFFAHLQLPATHRLTSFRPDLLNDAHLAVWTYSIREMTPTPAAAARLLMSSLEAMAPAATILVLEPGSKPSSHFLMETRDILARHGLMPFAPCAATATCSLRIANDWCHFTWRLPLGPFATRIAASAGRRAQELHFSWIAIRRASTPSPYPRLIALRPLNKQGTQMSLCTRDGHQTVVVAKKTATMTNLDHDRIGQCVSLPDPLPRRITDPADFEFPYGA